jgi:hypothetical protein
MIFRGRTPPPTESGPFGRDRRLGYHRLMAEESAQSLSEQLEEIRTQLAWVRDYL